MVNFWIAGNKQINGTIPVEIASMTNIGKCESQDIFSAMCFAYPNRDQLCLYNPLYLQRPYLCMKMTSVEVSQMKSRS